jgi:hypothetical protein
METDSPRLPPAPTWNCESEIVGGDWKPPPAGAGRRLVSPSRCEVPQRLSGVSQPHVARDPEVASHPSVLIYDDLVSKEYILANFDGIPPARPTVAEDVEIIDWPQYGLKAARCWALPHIVDASGAVVTGQPARRVVAPLGRAEAAEQSLDAELWRRSRARVHPLPRSPGRGFGGRLHEAGPRRCRAGRDVRLVDERAR